jgi:hypothetical protein
MVKAAIEAVPRCVTSEQSFQPCAHAAGAA